LAIIAVRELRSMHSDQLKRDCIALGVCVVRVSAVAVLCVGLASAAFPIHAEQKVVAPSQAGVFPTDAHAGVKLPDYVPVINYDQFLLASRDDFGGRDDLSSATLKAAEALSAKFAMSSARAGAGHLRVALQPDPLTPTILDAPDDPKRNIKVADLAADDGLVDPAKAAKPDRMDDTQTSAPAKTAARRETRASRQAAAPRQRTARHGHSRSQRNRVASNAVAPRSGSTTYNGIGADLQRLIGFGSLTPDHRLTN
jgi:hypothetical protein